ncbi:MAG: DNA gyrase modulator, partial [Acidimicrobiales bacterium]
MSGADGRTASAPPSEAEVELMAIATRVAEQAAAGEQLEAYVGRSVDTAVRVYEGEIEQLQSAQTEGIGIRVIKDGRVGFAYGGVLDEASVAEVLAEARDNVSFGTPDEWAGLASPDGVAPPELDLWRDDLATFATDDKVALALELERLTLAQDPRVRVEEAEYADAMGVAAVATSTGVRATGRESGCYLVVSTLAS